MNTDATLVAGPLGLDDRRDPDRTWTTIEPTRGWAPLRLGALWQYRELVYFLAWRDVKVRYKQTALGAAWAIIQPLLTMAVFSVIFGRVARLPSDGVPYPLFTFTALLPWTYFAYVLQESGNSVLNNAKMMSKVYFPRLALPLSTALAGLVDFAIAFGVLVGMLLIFGFHPEPRILALPLFLLLAVATSVGVGVWLSGLSAQYKDIKYVIPFLTQIWLLVSPVAYGAGVVTGKLALIYAFNPMAGVIEGFRWALLGTAAGPGLALLPSVIATVVLLVGGLYYFRRIEQTFADLV
jgi:lipopolysaccharide transport system permease protein